MTKRGIAGNVPKTPHKPFGAKTANEPSRTRGRRTSERGAAGGRPERNGATPGRVKVLSAFRGGRPPAEVRRGFCVTLFWAYARQGGPDRRTGGQLGLETDSENRPRRESSTETHRQRRTTDHERKERNSDRVDEPRNDRRSPEARSRVEKRRNASADRGPGLDHTPARTRSGRSSQTTQGTRVELTSRPSSY